MWLLLVCCQITLATDRKPNILFLFADDFRWDSFGYLGKFDVKTPNLDKLAERSVSFTRSYNTTAICQGSRAVYATGFYEYRTGTNFAHGSMDPHTWQKSYYHQLKNKGYFTGMIGKLGFHVLDETGKKAPHTFIRPSFDYWGAWLGQGKYDMTENKEADAWFERFDGKEEHTTHALGMMATDFIRLAAEQEKPFVLQVSFKAPHGPYAVDPRYKSVYKDKRFAKPQDYGYDPNAPAQAMSGRPKRLGEKWLQDKHYDKNMTGYHGLIYGMDMAIGSIFGELEKQGVADNTIVIFSADNGHFNGGRGYSGKLYAYEAGSRAPTYVYDPRNPTKQSFASCDVLTGSIDVAPTIYDYAGVKAPAGIQGKSLVPAMKQLAKGKAPAADLIHDSILLMQVWGTASAQSLSVVTPKAKFIHWFFGGERGGTTFERSEELFVVDKDPQERNNLVKNPEYKELLVEMHKHYDQHLQRWEKEQWVAPASFSDRSKDHGYGKYVRLADRNRDFMSNDPAEIAAMVPSRPRRRTSF
jgi:arylsulfatase A-like enzyme